MGKLVRLEVNNFKSYRGRHTLLFGDAHFTSIIGPNGSGKSNSMDAISFVLGVKSARLRSSNLADLIYRGRIIRTTKINADGTATEANGDTNGETQENGESQRDAPKSAWVKAVFEDDAEEIHEWQRIVNSSGSSEYRINGRQVSAKDYNDALEEQSILVKARNFLVFQGEVEKVAEKSPKALTEMVEQISGSLEKKADYERLKTESEAASENNAKHLAQRRQINAEIRTYQELKAEADEYEKKLAERDDAIVTHTLWKLFLYQQTMEKARSKIASHQEELQEHKRSVEKFHRRHEEARQAEAKVRREVAKTEKNMKEKQRGIEETSNTLAPIQEKIRLATQDRQKYASRIAELKQKRDAEQRHVEKYQKDLELVRKAEQKWEDDFKAAAQGQGRELSEDDLKEYNRLRGEVTRQTHANQAQIDRLKREVDTQKEETRNLKQNVDSHKEAIEKLTEEINRLKESQRTLDSATKELDTTRATKQQELDRLKSDRRQTQLQIQELNLLFQDTMKEKIALDSRRQESKKQQMARAALERLRDRFGREKIHGRYRDLFSIKQHKYRQAMGRVFGPQMEYIIVDTDATAKECISYLRYNKLGIMDFIPLDSVQIKAISPQVKGEHKGMRLAIDCINYDSRYERAMTAACASTMVCDTEDIAKELRFVKRIPAKAVTLDGVVIAKSGAQTGGASYYDKDTGDQGWDEQTYQTILTQLGSYEKELAELAKRDRSYKSEQDLEVELNDLREQIRINQEELKALGRNLESSKKQLDHHKRSLKASQPNYTQNSQRLQNLEEELKNYQEAVDSIADQIFGAFCQRLGYVSIRDYEAQQGGIQQEAAEKRLEFKKHRSQLQYVMKQHETMLQSIEERLRSAEEKASRDDALIATLQSQQDDLQKSLDGLEAELEALQEARAKLDAKLTERIKEVKETRRALDQRNEKVKHVLKEVDNEESKIKISATSRYNVLKQCRVDEIKIPLTADSKPLNSLPMTDMPRPDADAMDVDEDPDSTQVHQPEVDDYGIEINFDELQDDLKTELLEILEEEDQDNEKAQDHAVAALKDAEGKLTDQIARLDADISKATPNMRAGERLAAAEVKLQEVDQQFSDARKRAAHAKKAFEDVKQKRLTLFMKAFTHISENIGGTYRDLTKSDQFPLGGQAYLDMEDSTEPYLAGLKYHAMPPLKRFRDMEHLSGGEKTIAALALLFAIHSYQPSPFFVLDEVDAALDNVNVGRVTRYMKEHAGPGMQFIVISLKATFFQESESLVGVMRDQAKMSSKVICLDLRKYVPA